MHFLPILTLLLFLAAPAKAAQSSWIVDQAGGGDFTAIQQAIWDANVLDGDTVIVRDGTYFENINFWDKAITIKSEHGPAATIIDGNQMDSVVTFMSGEGPGSVLDGFTLTHGWSGWGGGIYCGEWSSPTIINNIITGNIGGSYGGGIYCYFWSNPTIANNIIANNRCSFHGGGIATYQSGPTIENNRIVNNSSGSGGGGIYIDRYDSILIRNNIISGNRTASYGGGILCTLSSTLSIEGCTIINNTADVIGGGIYMAHSTPSIMNTIVWGNSAPSNPEMYDIWGLPLVSYCNVRGGWPGTGNLNSDPLIVGDVHLSQTASGQTLNSPCVDTGYPMTSPIGTTRTNGSADVGVVDMGYHYTTSSVLLSANNLSGGAVATISMYHNNPGDVCLVGFSVFGGGSLPSPFGTVFLTPPFTTLPVIIANSQGVAQTTSWIPLNASGRSVWLHGFNRTAGLLTNPLAETIR